MNKPTLDADHALRQAGMTAETYLNEALSILEKTFDSFSREEFKRKPARWSPLLIALIDAQVKDFNAVSDVAARYELAEAVSELAQAVKMRQ